MTAAETNILAFVKMETFLIVSLVTVICLMLLTFVVIQVTLSCLAEQNLFYIFNWLRTSWCDPHPGIYRSFSGVLSNGEVYVDCNLQPNNLYSVVLSI